MRSFALAWLGLLLAGQAEAQTDMGAAAARERERRKAQATQPAPAYTNDDLGTRKPGGAPQPGARQSAPQPAATPAPAAGDDSAERRAQEAGWRARAQRARQQVNETAARVTALEDQIQKNLGRSLASTDTNEIIRLRAQKEGLEKQLAAAREANSAAVQQLADLEEEARRAGVPPGWLRER